jgi:transcriptional regulator with XRE-family HTH domain
MFYKDLGERIRLKRKQAKLTQNQVAQKLYVSPQAVSKWERGENAPDIALFQSLAMMLNTTVDWLLGSALEEHVRKAPLFSNFTENEIQLFLHCFERREVKKGQYIYKEKITSEQGLCILEKGEVLLSKMGEKGGTIRPGGYFSDLSAIDGKECFSSAMATADSTVFFATASRVKEAVGNCPSIGAKLYFRSLCGMAAAFRGLAQPRKKKMDMSVYFNTRFQWNHYF